MSGRGDRIRTCGLVVPNDARYQAALHPDVLCREVPDAEGRNRCGEMDPTASGGAPVGIRTPNLLIRSQVLYPVELRVLYQSPPTRNREQRRPNLRGFASLTREIYKRILTLSPKSMFRPYSAAAIRKMAPRQSRTRGSPFSSGKNPVGCTVGLLRSAGFSI